MTNSPKTAHVLVTDAEIRKHAAGTVRQLRDPRFPELRFRYSTTNRARGAWHVVVRGKWGKAGDYPGINAKLMQSTLPAILARRAADPDAVSTTSSWRAVGDVLTWYAERMTRDRALSPKRKAGAESALRCHLVPRLHAVELSTFNGPKLDQLLMWPMQERYKVSFVRFVYGVLAVAFSQALRLKMLPVNPMAALKFTDFISTRIRPKPARVRGDDLPALILQLAEQFESNPKASMLALMMLCHGTRLGETRLARWKNINLTTGLWFIPEADTKTKAEHTLPLTQQTCALLSRYRALQQASGYTGPHLFPGRTGSSVSASKASTLFSDMAKGEWSSHDLRKVARTGWADLGVDYMVGEMLLNHAMKDLDATYIHTTAEAMKRKALEAWHDHLDNQGFLHIHNRDIAGIVCAVKSLRATEHAAHRPKPNPSQGSTDIVAGGAQ